MAMRGRPKAPGMVQICFRVPSDVADFIREMSIKNDRQPGAELARMIRPAIETEKKRRAWEGASRRAAQNRARQESPQGNDGRSARRRSGPLRAGTYRVTPQQGLKRIFYPTTTARF